MAAAVEGAAVLVYGISRAYKESANCRLEAQYAYQQQKEMIPLMMEEGYRANGWLGMLLGVRMWYAFCGSVLLSEAAFEGKMEELCRELGDRGRGKHDLLLPPTSVTATLDPTDEQQPPPAVDSYTNVEPAMLVGIGAIAVAAVATVASRRLQP